VRIDGVSPFRSSRLDVAYRYAHGRGPLYGSPTPLRPSAETSDEEAPYPPQYDEVNKMRTTGFEVLAGPTDLPAEVEAAALEIDQSAEVSEARAKVSVSRARTDLEELWSVYRFWRQGWGP
jgi:hypothetical protein